MHIVNSRARTQIPVSYMLEPTSYSVLHNHIYFPLPTPNSVFLQLHTHRTSAFLIIADKTNPAEVQATNMWHQRIACRIGSVTFSVQHTNICRCTETLTGAFCYCLLDTFNQKHITVSLNCSRHSAHAFLQRKSQHSKDRPTVLVPWTAHSASEKASYLFGYTTCNKNIPVFKGPHMSHQRFYFCSQIGQMTKHVILLKRFWENDLSGVHPFLHGFLSLRQHVFYIYLCSSQSYRVLIHLPRPHQCWTLSPTWFFRFSSVHSFCPNRSSHLHRSPTHFLPSFSLPPFVFLSLSWQLCAGVGESASTKDKLT